MYLALTIFAVVLGALVTLTAVFTAWVIWHHARSLQGNRQDNLVEAASRYLLKWTLFDYAVLFLFLAGMLFLLTDLIAVIRDHEFFPMYHYGYLMSGFIFTFVAMVFMFIRLGIVLRMSRSNDSSTADHHNQPTQTNHSEERI
jgi:hypothetical protein